MKTVKMRVRWLIEEIVEVTVTDADFRGWLAGQIRHGLVQTLADGLQGGPPPGARVDAFFHDVAFASAETPVDRMFKITHEDET